VASVPSVASTNDLRDTIAGHRRALAAQLGAAGEDGLALGRRNAAFLDEVMRARFDAARTAAGMEGSRGLALAAVGSFGRGAVALRSDVDVVVVVEPRSPAAARAPAFAEALLYPLWDSSLAVGHQVLDARDAIALAQQDLATATALLDLRLLAGDAALAGDLVDRAYAGLFAEGELGAFVERLDEEAAARHARFGGSVYLLEPDVKSGAGGLRDLDGARWAARARWRVACDGVWQALVRVGVLVAREANEIAAAEELLWRVRNRLHVHAARKSDRLSFDEQEAIAVELGFGDSADRASAAERFMQEHYRHAAVVSRAREQLLERARPPKRRTKSVAGDGTAPVELGLGVHLFDGQVTIAGAAELHADPALALRLYAACVRHGAPVLAYARDAVARAAADPTWCEQLRAGREAATVFVDLLCSVAEAKTRRGSIAAELHDVGLLLAMIPEFAPVTGRVHHDVYHVYTVDVHSVAALDRLAAITRGELAHDYPLASRLAAEVARPRPLFLATLLHDIGKGWPDATGSRKSHSKSGADLCDKILPRLGLASDEVAEARELVLQHLAMYHAATRRDLDDAATIEEFCRLVRGREGLRDLYLLTVADISTTSPTAMTSWKARMLDELYFASDAHLAGERAGFDKARVAQVREAVRALWSEKRDKLDRFLASMPERYLLANEPEAIVAHARAAIARGPRAAHVARAASAHADVVELSVVAEDRPGLLARIAAALTAGRLEVLAAQVWSRALDGGRSEAVDVFWVRDRVEGAEGVERGIERLARDLEDVCSSRVDPADLLRVRTGSASPWRERPSPAVVTEVVVDDRASPRHTVIEVFAKDRPGLLYTLARTLHELGLSIALSKINTEGTKVADVFYVSELDGSKVAPGERTKAVREGILRALG
jgi:[protein-PII] uridylyltransferase